MINNFKLICMASLIIPSILLANTAVVNTNILLVKKKPSNQSTNNRYYEMNKVINIQEKVDGLDSDEQWYKTPNGYVKAKYILLEDELPKFISKDEVDYSKYALQLIVYKNTVVQSLVKLRKLLKNEDNIYLEETKNVYVIYLVNFDSYRNALNKSNKLKRIFTTNFITKVKNDNNIKNEVEENVNSKNIILKKEKEDNLNKLIKPKKEEVSTNNQATKKERIILETKEVLTRPDKNGIKEIRNLESVTVIEVKKEKKINNLNFKPEIKAPSYEEMLEKILIELNK